MTLAFTLNRQSTGENNPNHEITIASNRFTAENTFISQKWEKTKLPTLLDIVMMSFDNKVRNRYVLPAGLFFRKLLNKLKKKMQAPYCDNRMHCEMIH